MKEIKNYLVGLDKRFTYRGMNQTRIETFSDAVFAVAFTLVVLTSSVPNTFDELRADIQDLIPSFICIVLIVVIWYQHYIFFLRYGLQNVKTVTINTFLIFLVLIYIYPLRLIFGAFFANATDGALPSGLNLTLEQLGDMFVVFGIGFSAMSGVLAALYLLARNRQAQLLLNDRECRHARSEATTWLIVAATGLVSTLAALMLPAGLSPAAGYIYWSLIITLPVQAYLSKRGRRLPDPPAD